MNTALPFDPALPIGEASVTTVLIADDHLLVRDGLKLLVTRIMGKVQFYEANSADSLVNMTRQRPLACVALVDLNMPGMDKGNRLVDIAHQSPWLPIVVISALTSPDIVRRALQLPTVYAFVSKSASAEHMRAAIDSAILRAKLPYIPSIEKVAEPDVDLPPRLQEIRSLLRQGLSNKLIASQLGITEGTVKNYMSEIFKALNVSNRTQAAQFDSNTA